ncbi:hypothetical protein BP6252_06492 [Coleophoma cylindrospora]|uniref:SMP-30/Gluconolactonase/LRE-like region domain-containing protein n=1 Tax=Coleophoma cylindrospora TaxID=1849047 RepID=A0A3D8RN29_9HELO|nr:hypothetical protein BP6252_06492 [Coleophoma cylindrospora]
MYTTFLTTSLVLLSAISPAVSSPTVRPRTPSFPLDVTILQSFGQYTWCENLAIRSNGQILTTRLDTPEIIQVDPLNETSPITVYSWNASEYKGILGITETVNDVFYVAASAMIDDYFVKTSGTPAIYQVNMTTFAVEAGEITSAATVTKLTDIPEADFLNGMTTLNNTTVLVADVYNGWVYGVNTATGAYSIYYQDEKMQLPANPSTNLSVNGLKISDSYLYWTNTAVGSLNRIEIDSTGATVGTSEVVAANVPKADDFVIKSDGAIFVAQNQMDELSYLAVGASAAVVAAGSNISTTLAGVTAGHFGRSGWDANRLYLSTSGGLALAINGSITVPGTISYVDTTGF